MKHKENILKLREQGKSYREIQKILGCSKGTIAYHLGDGQKQKNLTRGNLGKAKRRRQIWEYKENIGCIDCKEKYPHYILEFDHRPGFEKIGSPTEMAAYFGIEAAMEEIKKCDVVCANCHKIRTYNRNQNKIGKIPTR
jgi:transposase